MFVCIMQARSTKQSPTKIHTPTACMGVPSPLPLNHPKQILNNVIGNLLVAGEQPSFVLGYHALQPGQEDLEAPEPHGSPGGGQRPPAAPGRASDVPPRIGRRKPKGKGCPFRFLFEGGATGQLLGGVPGFETACVQGDPSKWRPFGSLSTNCQKYTSFLGEGGTSSIFRFRYFG